MVFQSDVQVRDSRIIDLDGKNSMMQRTRSMDSFPRGDASRAVGRSRRRFRNRGARKLEIAVSRQPFCYEQHSEAVAK